MKPVVAALDGHRVGVRSGHVSRNCCIVDGDDGWQVCFGGIAYRHPTSFPLDKVVNCQPYRLTAKPPLRRISSALAIPSPPDAMPHELQVTAVVAILGLCLTQQPLSARNFLRRRRKGNPEVRRSSAH